MLTASEVRPVTSDAPDPAAMPPDERVEQAADEAVRAVEEDGMHVRRATEAAADAYAVRDRTSDVYDRAREVVSDDA